MYNYNNRLSVTHQSDGTVLDCSSSSADGYYLCNKGGTSSGSNQNVIEFTTPLCFEVDIVEWVTSSLTALYVSDGVNSDSNFTFENRVTSDNHLKLTYVDGKFNLWVDNNQIITDYAKTFNELFRIGFKVGNGTSIKYKNLKVYPI